MAKARVELRGCITHSARGRSFKKGVPQILTNPSDILYYQSQGDFSVSMLDDDPVPQAAPKAKAVEPEPDEPEAEEPEADDEPEAEEPKKPVGGAKPVKQKVKATK